MTLLYRITHIDNLPGLLSRGCDSSPNSAKVQGITKRAAADRGTLHPGLR